MPQIFAGGAVSDIDEDAQPAFAPATAFVGSGGSDGPSLDELEAQMGGEVAARDALAPRAPSVRHVADSDEDEETVSGGKTAALPELDTLVGRLPAEVRETLDDLFRARFVSVKKLPKRVFQAVSAKARSDAS